VPSDGQCYQYTLTGTDNVGNTATFQTIVLVDTSGPTGGSLSYVDGLASLGSVTIDWVGGSDPESGIASVQIERATATLTGSTCGGFGAFTPLGGPIGSSPTVDSSVRRRQLLCVPARGREQHGPRLDVHVARGREDHKRLADHHGRG